MITRVESDYNSLKTVETSIQSNALPETFNKIVKYQMKTLEYGKMTHQTALKWLQSMKTDIESQLKKQ